MIDEKELIESIKAGGGNRSFRILYDFYFPALYHFVYQYVKSAETAEEIAHDAFIRLWTSRDRLDERRSVKAYLFTIARNQLIKELRRQLRNPLLRDHIEFIGTLGTESRILYDYDTYVRAVRKAKELLTPRQKEIYIMSREDDLSVPEIAESLSITPQVVRNQLSAAMKKIREYLKLYL